MPTRTVRRWVTGVALTAATAATALGQDYTVSSQSGLYQAPPPGNTQIAISNTQTVTVQLPFTFPYYGQGYSSVLVCSEGYILFGTASAAATTANATFPRSGTTDGICAPYWDDLSLNVAGQVRHWTTGASPNRTWTVSWEGIAIAASTTSRIHFQVRLFEDLGRIEFAYKSAATSGPWGTSSYTPGIDAYGIGDNRFVTPPGMNVTNNNGHPPADYRFEPVVRIVSGQLLYDRVASDATGFGAGVYSNLPLSDVRVELRAANGSLCGAGTTDSGGNFFVAGVALRSSSSGSLVASARNGGCNVVLSPGGQVYTRTIATGVPFSGDSNQGTLALTSSDDPGDTYLPAFHIASVIGGLRRAVQPLTANAIVAADVLYDRDSNSPTSFTRPFAPNNALLRIASAASANPDAWDTDVILKCYAAGQVLGCISAYSTLPYDGAFDAITTPENAFAEGFGYGVFASYTGRSDYVDATSATTAVVRDLDSPAIGSRKGPDVAAWVAAALFDLVDDADEPHDLADGTVGTAAQRGFLVADSLASAPTADTFHAAWGALSMPAAQALTRDFVFHGLLADDPLEMNDFVEEPAALGAPGFRREGLVLNRYDEDWFEVTVAAPTGSLGADVDFDRSLAVTPALEIRDSSNVLVATGSAPNAFSPFTAQTGPVPAGTYRVRVAHAGGARLAAYALQIHVQLSVSVPGLAGWTVDTDINHPAPIVGGIPPYTYAVDLPFVKPDGLILDAATQTIRGRPSAVGSYEFLLTVRDGGNPRHEAAVVQSFTVNPPLRIRTASVIGVPIGRPLDVELAHDGGTAPFVFTTTGALPAGLALSSDTLRLTGTPTVAGASTIQIRGTDVAGSSSQAVTTIVVAGPVADGSAALHADAGETASGLHFDALGGSTVSVVVKTAKGKAKRALRPSVVTADGVAVAGGKLSAGTGTAKVSGVPCPHTGRYFVVLEAGDGDATDLVASVKVTPPKSGSGGDPTFRPGEFHDVVVGAIAGAKLTLNAKPDAASGLALRGLLLLDPDGLLVPIDGLAFEKGRSVTIKATLAKTGEWTVRLGAKPGQSGSMTYTYKVAQPKGGVFVLPD